MSSRHQVILLSVFAAGLVTACSSSDGPTPLTPGVKCSTSTPINLAVGESVVLDATVAKGCIRIPAAGPGGAEHLIVAYSGSGQVQSGGVSGPYALGSQNAASPAPPIVAGISRVSAPDPAREFHMMLRERESELALEPGRRLAAPRVPQTPPSFGDSQKGKGFVNSFRSSSVTPPISTR